MKNQKGIINLALSVVIAAILLGAVAVGYFWYLPKVNENKNTNQVVANTNVKGNQNTNIKANTNAAANANTNAAVDEISGWIICVVDKPGGFSFRYPADWVKKTEGFIQEATWERLQQGSGFWFSVDPTAGIGYEYLTEDLGSTSVDFDGYTTVIKKSSNSAGNVISLLVNFNKSGHEYHLRYEFFADNQDNISYYENIFNLILSTFQFTGETAGWQTYESSKYKYSIKYPPASSETSDPGWDVIITPSIQNCSFRYNGEGLGRGVESYSSLSSEQVIIDGKTMNGIRWAYGDTGKLALELLKDENISWIELFYPNDENNSSCKNVLDIMLSTFQFTD